MCELKGIEHEYRIHRNLESVFTWRHDSQVGVPKQWDGGRVGALKQSCGSWIFFLCKNVFLFAQICLAVRTAWVNMLIAFDEARGSKRDDRRRKTRARGECCEEKKKREKKDSHFAIAYLSRMWDFTKILVLRAPSHSKPPQRVKDWSKNPIWLLRRMWEFVRNGRKKGKKDK